MAVLLAALAIGFARTNILCSPGVAALRARAALAMDSLLNGLD
jgi:hypothetical protein